MSHILKNNTGSDVSLDNGRVLPASGQLIIDKPNLYAFANSNDVLTKLADATLTLNDGTSDLALSAAIDHLKGVAPVQPIDPDTGMPSVSTRKLPSSWYPEFREIEFTTSKLNSIHDKDEADNDIGHHSTKYYKLDGGSEVEMISPTQVELDTYCIKTVIEFAPNKVWAIRGAYTRQITIPSTPVYVWATFLIYKPEYSGHVRNPYANGGLNMEFQDVRQSVGDEGENYTFLNAEDKIEWIIRHEAGLQHRIRVIYQLGFEVGS